MPGIELFNRRWNIASDDLFYPGLFGFIGRLLWFIPQLAYYIYYQADFKCADIELLHIYYIGFLFLMASVILNQLFIVFISSRGTISNIQPRSKINIFLYIKIFLTLSEFVWSVIGTIWLVKIKWNSCSKLINISIMINIVFCWFAILFILIVLIVLFDPISHLPEHDVTKKRSILYSRLKNIFFCCYCCLYTGNSRNNHYENSYQQISSILELIFRGGNLTPSDVLAGIILLSNKEKDQFNREIYLKKKIKKLLAAETRPIWMNINEAAYYVKYAIATYSWPYYIYMHNLRGFRDICCSHKTSYLCCSCCFKPSTKTTTTKSTTTTTSQNTIQNQDADSLAKNLVIHGDTKSRRHLKAFKFLSKIKDCDLIYANFENDLFFVPFCVLIDHFKKSVVITIRGTLSLRDVITDITADCGYFDVQHLLNQPCHIGILNTAENIYKKIKDLNLLEPIFREHPTYNLLVTGHSLGAGTAVILSLKLKTEYANLKCIAYSPPGGLISTSLADYTKSFVMSVVLGDDIVPRLSLRSVHQLKADILKEVYNCNLAKYKILWKYSINFLSSKAFEQEEQLQDYLENLDQDDSDDDDISILGNSLDNSQSLLINSTVKSVSSQANIKSVDDIQIVENTNTNNSNSESLKPLKVAILAYQQVNQMLKTVHDTYPDLHLPGHILYIYQTKSANNQTHNNKCRKLCSKVFCFCCNRFNKTASIDYDCRFSSRDEFKKILITNRILMDHFPNNVENSLKYFRNDYSGYIV